MAFIGLKHLRLISCITRTIKKQHLMTSKLALDEDIANAINQYLVLTGLPNAAKAFQSDCEQRKTKLTKPITASNQQKCEEYTMKKKKLMQYFGKGEASQFLKLWNTLFPADNDRNEAVNVLEFYIRVYFATFPLRKSPLAKGEYRERIHELKNYLEEGAGSKLSATPELVQYFALPYVDEPVKHPVFKELSQKKWAKGVAEKLERHLNRHGSYLSDEMEPKLVQWMESFEQNGRQSDSANDYRELQDDYYKLLDIAAELVDCIEQACRGKQISAEYFADISSRLMDLNAEAEQRMQRSAAGPKMKAKRNRSLRLQTDGKKKGNASMKKSESAGTLVPADPKARAPSNMEEEDTGNAELIAQLNYTKIVNQLIKNTAGRTGCLLLQALRQQLTRVPKNAAIKTIETFAENDILSLKHRKTSVVASIVSQGDAANEVKEELGRFLNALASFRTGRNYLLTFGQGRELLVVLTAALKSKKLHHFAGEHTIATLQKLSLRFHVQKELLQLGMLEWLSCILSTKLSNFSLEFGCAMLMNLCLNPFSNSVASRIAHLLLSTIVILLKSNNNQICKYLNGTLYSILGVGRVRARAREINLESVLTAKLDASHCEDDSAQIPQLLRILNGEAESHSYRRAISAEEDDDQGDDYLEAEIESTDSVRAAANELFGASLLDAKFRLWSATEKEVRSREVVGRDEITAPPGTVPRRPPRLRHPIANTRGRFGSSASRFASLSAESINSADRPCSNSSQHTFILENDRRKPLVARDAFRPAAFISSQAQRKPKAGMKERISPNRISSKVMKRGLSESEQPKASGSVKEDSNSNDTEKCEESVEGEEQANEFLPDVPVTSNVPRRIPSGANTYDYIAAFGSRPKVARTPDNNEEDKTKGEPCDGF